ncbi:hypothetical protein M5K25_027668 [Dendrobium thyrsiflorum]|uniref:Uncharacterized protein n=1 Tax=Dendrobium thyrsiflorum TaxID=117978 RepID=A0ABD0TUT7_DENTH
MFPADHCLSDLYHQTTVFPTSVARRLRSFRPPSLTTTTIFRTTIARYYGPSNLHHQTTVFLTSVARRLWSFRPLSPDYGLYDLHSQTMIFLTSVTRRLRSFRPPSPDYRLSDLSRLSTMKIDPTAMKEINPIAMKNQITVFPTSIACRLRSFQPSSPTDYGLTDLCHQTTVFSTSIAHRLRSFRPSLSANYGPSDLYRLSTMSLQPLSPENCLYNLCRPPTMVFPTSIALRLRSFRPSQITVLLPSVTSQRSFRPPSPVVTSVTRR